MEESNLFTSDYIRLRRVRHKSINWQTVVCYVPYNNYNFGSFFLKINKDGRTPKSKKLT